MTGEPNFKGNPDLAGGEISSLVKVIGEYARLMDSRVGRLPDGTLSTVGEHCVRQIEGIEAALSSPDLEPENLADVAALVLLAKGQCLVAAEKSRDLNPFGATEQIGLAIDLLKKVEHFLEIETGPVGTGTRASLN
jgi:hypothetical protein